MLYGGAFDVAVIGSLPSLTGTQCLGLPTRAPVFLLVAINRQI